MSSDALLFLGPEARLPAAVGHNPLDTPLAFQTPRLMSDVSAWVQHIPFAFSLIEMLRPRRLVELGTFKGDSYCAFCQAVDLLQLHTECTAVDTWMGDPQSGLYDGQVLQALASYHDPLYGTFSKLLRSTFDDAVQRFADGSIDLLHLDGLHNYIAVRHDFETWRPKLSEGAVVLFHDINVHHGDFGVYRLWEELRPHYPHFEFLHGYGLGVLVVGRNTPQRMQKFIAAATLSPDPVRRCFHALGQRLELGRGMALLAEDIAKQELQANVRRSGRQQPARDVLPDDLTLATFLDGAQSDVKRNIDRIHETSLNHLDDMRTLAAENDNLSHQMAELQGHLKLVEGIEQVRLSDSRELASLRQAISQLSDAITQQRRENNELRLASSKRYFPPAALRAVLVKARAFLASLSG